jgi:hypothetical protein
VVPIVWSNSSMISAAVRTGMARSPRIAVMNRDHVARGRRNQVIPGARILITVVM